MEDAHEESQAPSPPGKVVLSHALPIIKREAPILAPFGGERVGLEGLFRRCADRAFEIEDVRVAPDIGAMHADADGHVSHQRNSLALGMLADCQPLRIGDPLHVGVEAHEIANVPLAGGSERFHPDPNGGRRAMFSGPLVGESPLFVPAHEGAVRRVIRQPVGIAFFKSANALPLALSRVRERKVLKAA